MACEMQVADVLVRRDLEPAAPALWDLCGRLISDLQQGRPPLAEKIDALRPPCEDAHRTEWERRARGTEVEDLRQQLAAAETRLATRQRKLGDALHERDGLAARRPGWEADLACALGLGRAEGVRYAPGLRPEKLGLWARGAAGAAARVQHMPFTRGDAGESYLGALGERLARERRERAEARRSLEHQLSVEEAEHDLWMDALREQSTRLHQRHAQASAHASEVEGWHLRLSAEHETLKGGHAAEVCRLQAANEVVAQTLHDTTFVRQAREESAESRGRKRKEKASQSQVPNSQVAARDEARILQGRVQEVRDLGLRQVQELERCLGGLQLRYQRVVHHRIEELAALQKDILALQRATRQCEQLAVRCVDMGRGDLSNGRHESARKVEALALRPAVAKLRWIWESCKVALGEECCSSPAGVGEEPGLPDS